MSITNEKPLTDDGSELIEIAILDGVENGKRFRYQRQWWRKLGPDSNGAGIPCQAITDGCELGYLWPQAIVAVELQ